MKFGWTAWLMQLKQRGHLSVQELASGYSLGDQCQIHAAIDPLPLSLYADHKLPLTLHVNRHQASVGTAYSSNLLHIIPMQVPKILTSVGYITTFERIHVPTNISWQLAKYLCAQRTQFRLSLDP